MAGAANVTLFPFPLGLFESELDRLEERLGPRKAVRRGLTSIASSVARLCRAELIAGGLEPC